MTPPAEPLPLWKRQDFVGGLAVIAVAVFAFWQGNDLPLGTLGGMGPGMLPRSLAVLLGLLGALLVLDSILEGGLALDRWSIRGPVFVLGAVVAFGVVIRGTTVTLPFTSTVFEIPSLGLLVAGPLALVIAALASDEVRWKETIVFGIAMTAFCIVLFKYMLGLPIPLAPWLLGY